MWITKRVNDRTHITYGVGWMYAILGVMTIGYLGQTGTLITLPIAVGLVWGLVKWIGHRRAKTGASK